MPNLAEIRERWAKGTPGPWEVNDRREIGMFIFKRDKTVGNFVRVYKDKNIDSIANADKIANAPTDIAFLLAEVERLRERLRPKNSWAEEMEDVIKEFYPEEV